ncbi:amidohydrolase [bacterium]|nr:MAG: amidohydrolase [bacterium]
MKINKLLFLFILALIFSSCSKKPDVLYVNGKIHTFDNENTTVEAIAVRDGKILKTGTTEEIRKDYNIENQVDLQGKVVLPGFIDCQGYLILFAKNLHLLDLRDVSSSEQLKKKLKDKVTQMKAGDRIIGLYLNENNFKEDDIVRIDKDYLDKTAPGNEIFIVNLRNDIGWSNSKGLESMKVTKMTPSPPKGEILKDDNGELLGVFLDSAVNLLIEKLNNFSKKEMQSSVDRGINELLKYGITEIHDRMLDKEGINLIKELADSGKMALRIYVILSAGDPSFTDYMKSGIEENYKDRITVRAVSVDFDGAFALQKAVMKDDYKIEPRRAVGYADTIEIEKAFREASDKKFQFCVKTVGDLAVNKTLNAIEKVIKDKGLKDHRTVLEQIQFISQNDISRFKDLNIIPQIAPEVTMENFEYVNDLIAKENKLSLGLWNSMLQASGRITSGSDFPFQTINPFVQIYYLLSRQYTDTTRMDIPNSSQKLNLIDAIKSYTIWAAYSGFEEKVKGSIEKGKYADMIVISDDIFNSDTKKLLDTKVLKTIINGKVVYDRGTLK